MNENKPVDKVQSGPISAAIWKNQGKEKIFYTVTLEKVYKEGEEFKTSASFGTNDLAHVALASYKASIAIDAIAEIKKGRTR